MLYKGLILQLSVVDAYSDVRVVRVSAEPVISFNAKLKFVQALKEANNG